MNDNSEKKKMNKKQENYETSSIKASVNYVDHKRNRTSVSYDSNGVTLSTFISGIHNGMLTIEYKDNVFISENITRIKRV